MMCQHFLKINVSIVVKEGVPVRLSGKNVHSTVVPGSSPGMTVEWKRMPA
jgi:hypothetical protein